MEMVKTLLVIGLSILGGVAGGYYGAQWAPVSAQVAIVDVQSFVKRNASGTPAEDNALRLTQRIQSATQPLIERGIIVLDAQAVVDAPEEAYVDVE
jgi:hypothetical protein